MIRRLPAAATILAAALACASTFAADEPPRPASAAASPAPATPATTAPEAPLHDGEARVVIFNRTVATFRTTFLGVNAADRAKRAERAVREVLDKGGQGKVTTAKEGQRVGVFLDGELVFVIVAGDADRLRNESLDAIVTASKTALCRE